MQGTIAVAASDVEPGAVGITVTAEDGRTFVIPLRGYDLVHFAEQLGAACTTAFMDIAAATLNDQLPPCDRLPSAHPKP
jgi:hypothetical protein